MLGLGLGGCVPGSTQLVVPYGKSAMLVDLDSAGRVLSAREVRGAVSGATDLRKPGVIAVAGRHDAHIHIMGTGKVRERVNLRGASRAELKTRIAAFARQHPDVAVITGRGWDQSRWQDKTFPTWRDLEGATDKPVLVRRVDGHAALANKAMMKLAGINKTARAPQGGRIERDKDGELTGMFVDTAMELVRSKVPPPTAADRRRWLRAAVVALADDGFVAAHDMGMDLETLAALQAEDSASPLPIRVLVYLDGDDKGAMQWLRDHRGPARRLSPRIEVMGVKLFADGAMGSRGAALMQDYSDKPGHKGALIQQPDKLNALVKAVHELGAQVAIHAIGDRAVKLSLDAIEAAQGGDTSRRHRIEHAQLVRPEDFSRFAKLGVTASMQPCHLLSDRRWVIARLGAERAKGAYAWATMQHNGVLLAFGSDSPVEPFHYRRNLGAALLGSENSPENKAHASWIGGRQLNVEHAARGFSVGAATAVHRGQRDGAASALSAVFRAGRVLELTLLDSTGAAVGTVIGATVRRK